MAVVPALGALPSTGAAEPTGPGPSPGRLLDDPWIAGFEDGSENDAVVALTGGTTPYVVRQTTGGLDGPSVYYESIMRRTPAGTWEDVRTFTSELGFERAYSAIAVAPDGDLVLKSGTGIDRIDPEHPTTITSVDTTDGAAKDLVVTSDGAVWFTTGDSFVARLSGGSTNFFVDPGITEATALAPATDRSVWFTSVGNDRIGRVSPAGQIATFADPNVDAPRGIALGSDGNMWFTSSANDRIGRITAGGAITTFGGGGVDDPRGITSGPDGLLFVASRANGRVGVLEPSTGVTSTAANPFGGMARPEVIEASGTDLFLLSDGQVHHVFEAHPPGPARHLRAPAGHSDVVVKWGAPADSGGWPASYRVLRDGVPIATTTETRVTDTGLTPGTSYQYQVVAFNDRGDGPPVATPGRPGLAGHSTFDLPREARRLAVGPDGSVWFTRSGDDRIGRLTAPARSPSTRIRCVGYESRWTSSRAPMAPCGSRAARTTASGG